MNKRWKPDIALGAGTIVMHRLARLVLLVASTLAFALAPFSVSAQQAGKVWRIGFLSHDAVAGKRRLAAFEEGLRALGYVEGTNFVIEQRYGGGKDERLPELAAELVRFKVDILLVHAEPAAVAAKKATTTIPILMVAVADPIGSGLVSSLAHPGANLTGLSDLHGELVGKRLQLLKELVPRASRFAVLSNPNPSCLRQLKDIQSAAKPLGVSILSLEAKAPDDIDRAFATIKKEHAAALLVCGDQVLFLNGTRIYDHAVRDHVPTIYTQRGWVDAGGLMSYGANFDEMYRRLPTYVDKILHGAKPGDLPVEQPTKFELVINMKAAKVLGIKIPNSILVRADKVIE